MQERLSTYQSPISVLSPFHVSVFQAGSYFHTVTIPCFCSRLAPISVPSLFHVSVFQAGWKENHAAFISELKNLQATSLSTFGRGLKEAFDLLNIHRLHTSIDHYGLGLNPFYLEPAIVIALTDGGRLNNPNNIESEVGYMYLIS